MKIFTIVTIILFGGIFIRIGYLQLYQGDRYLKQSEDNRLKVVDLSPVRGLIFDRLGRIIVENTPSYSIVSAPTNILDNPQTMFRLRKIFREPDDNGWENSARKFIDKRPEIKLKRDIEFASLAAVETNRYFLPGISVKVESKRFYPYHTAVHIIGYLGEISSSELSLFKGSRAGDIVGKKGIEKSYNQQLFGQRGYEIVEVNACGHEIRGVQGRDNLPPMNGSDIHLTIDLELQMLAEDLLSGKQGAVVAIDPNNGDILAMASAPDYNPEVFAGVIRKDDWESLVQNPGKPLLNRCIQGTYPPGSITKMVILAAALEEELVTPQRKIFCPGYMQLGRRTFRCWKEGGHGSVDALKAIEQSCDVYFYQLGLELGINKMAEYLNNFGFGVNSGVDIENESAGLVPDSSYMNRRYGEGKWTRGHLLNIAIGQGDLLVTPLQLAVYCAALANGGKIVVPHLLKGMVYHNPDKWKGYKPSFHKIEGVSARTLDILRQGMLNVVAAEHGTASWLKNPNLAVAGKTGTAQNPHGEDHALFIGFAPYENPVIAVCAIVEYGEHGSTTAAPIVMKIIKRYLRDKIPDERSMSDKTVG